MNDPLWFCSQIAEYMLKPRLGAVVRSPRREPWEKTPAPLSPDRGERNRWQVEPLHGSLSPLPGLIFPGSL